MQDVLKVRVVQPQVPVPMLEPGVETQPLKYPWLKRVVLVKIGEPTPEGEAILVADIRPVSVGQVPGVWKVLKGQYPLERHLRQS